MVIGRGRELGRRQKREGRGRRISACCCAVRSRIGQAAWILNYSYEQVINLNVIFASLKEKNIFIIIRLGAFWFLIYVCTSKQLISKLKDPIFKKLCHVISKSKILVTKSQNVSKFARTEVNLSDLAAVAHGLF